MCTGFGGIGGQAAALLDAGNAAETLEAPGSAPGISTLAAPGTAPGIAPRRPPVTGSGCSAAPGCGSVLDWPVLPLSVPGAPLRQSILLPFWSRPVWIKSGPARLSCELRTANVS